MEREGKVERRKGNARRSVRPVTNRITGYPAFRNRPQSHRALSFNPFFLSPTISAHSLALHSSFDDARASLDTRPPSASAPEAIPPRCLLALVPAKPDSPYRELV